MLVGGATTDALGGGGVCASFRAATGGATTDYQVMALELAQALGLSAALDAPTDAP